MTPAQALKKIESALALDLRGEKGEELSEAVAVLRAKIAPRKRKSSTLKLPAYKFVVGASLLGRDVVRAYHDAMGRDEDRSQYSREAIRQFEKNAA
jgi:hypothetical protein